MGAMPTLTVHEVGAFEASFVPTVADFARLDRRFSLPPQVWDSLGGYRDWGFAVFKLKHAGAAAKIYHPMAMEFAPIDPAWLFFPTLHVHDGAIHATANFFHSLYCQFSGAAHIDTPGSEAWSEPAGYSKTGSMASPWGPSPVPIMGFVDGRRAEGTVNLDDVVYRRALVGQMPNRDQWLRLR
jgi:hypothetical protein